MASRSLVILSSLLLICASIVVVLGAYTRLADAGLGCPDWPTCYGHLWVPNSEAEIAHANAQAKFAHSPVETHKTWPEQIHRIFASSLGVLILICFAISNVRRARNLGSSTINSVSLLLVAIVLSTIARIIFGERLEPLVATLLLLYFANLVRLYRQTKRGVKAGESGIPFYLISSLSGLVIVQGLFGMWTVTLKLWPQVVTAHLLGGFTTLCLISTLFLKTVIPVSPKLVVPKGLSRMLCLGLVFVVIQITLGGWTSSNYAALACPDLPTCQNELVPEMNFAEGFNIFQHIGPNYLGGKLDNQARTAIHFSHRVGALCVSVLLGFIAFSLIRMRNRRAKRYGCVIASVLALQISLGLSNIALALPISVAVLHNAGGALLLIVIAWVLRQTRPSTGSTVS